MGHGIPALSSSLESFPTSSDGAGCREKQPEPDHLAADRLLSSSYLDKGDLGEQKYLSITYF